MGELIGPDGEPFDRSKVFPYAFRHSYAQRLADEGATESELMDLMDHDSLRPPAATFGSAPSDAAERPSSAARLCLTIRAGG